MVTAFSICVFSNQLVSWLCPFYFRFKRNVDDKRSFRSRRSLKLLSLCLFLKIFCRDCFNSVVVESAVCIRWREGRKTFPCAVFILLKWNSEFGIRIQLWIRSQKSMIWLIHMSSSNHIYYILVMRPKLLSGHWQCFVQKRIICFVGPVIISECKFEVRNIN